MGKDISNILGPTIKSYRERLGISQGCLAERLNSEGVNIDRTMIVKIESQTRRVSDYELLAITKILKIKHKNIFKDISK
ncbi:helix-turn-helix transcriptional regulator [Clostridium bowmanii]|uniref:helix-turn-helix domain-containing protein n=1 Tax=Clostridium bowmanii TaxID=132925 RepID=UPI001C0C379D|nr:helix-turn-helix transcriptional regulator [Clostridium bowmanii]MBU3190737.1 helix-turn-helix transcriptional regulator [Clostridium bowmanii]MCA1075017.1 helix-turn-helix transcriptional regulator [Clostridium bowmanii]